MTVQDIITDARAKLGDSVAPYQWIDDNFYTPINNGIRDIATKNPDALYVTAITTSLPADVDAISDDVLITDMYRNDLIELVVVQMRQEDQTRRKQQYQQPVQPQPIQPEQAQI